MTRPIIALCVVLVAGLMATPGSSQPANGGSSVRLLLSEVQAGTMASEQYCTLVFADHRFHSEKANRKLGKDRDRKVYEGKLSEADWDALSGILDSKEFRELNVAQGVPPWSSRMHTPSPSAWRVITSTRIWSFSTRKAANRTNRS
jgi:hypothetical protein